jgi:diguanylate cyclase (GGDEF)-like protein
MDQGVVWLVSGGVLAGGALLRASALARQLGACRERVAQTQHELSVLRRELGQLQSEHRFLSRFVREFPHLTRELHTGVSERRIPDVLLHIVMRILEPRRALILLRRRKTDAEPERGHRFVIAATSSGEGPVRKGTELPMGSGSIGLAAELQSVMDRRDFEAQSLPTRSRLQEEALSGFDVDLAAPLLFGEETLGMIVVEQPASTSSDSKDALRLVAQIASLALHNAQAYAEMKVSADIDGLTQVLNKRQMTRRLTEAVQKVDQQGGSVSVFLFDIDHFKHYNDANGHVAGDTLLRALARLVEENTRRGNTFGRFGGEEFLLIVPAPAEDALRVAEKLRALIAAHPFPMADTQPLGALTVSGGVAEYPGDARDSTGLIHAADQALYACKRDGRNQVRRFTAAHTGGRGREGSTEGP